MQWRLNACRSQCTSAVPAPPATTPRTFGQPLTNGSTVRSSRVSPSVNSIVSADLLCLLDQNDSILIDVRARADRGTRHPLVTQSQCTRYLPSRCTTSPAHTSTRLDTYTNNLKRFL
jgi:hypothetical protein